MSLEEWLENKWIKEQPTNSQEILALLEKVRRDIKESKKEVITPDWRLSIAYNACLGCATIALRATGYRIPGGSGQHYRTIQSFRFSINPDSDLILLLEAIAKKRAVVNYDASGTVTNTEVDEAVELAEELYELTMSWLQTTYPDLIK